MSGSGSLPDDERQRLQSRSTEIAMLAGGLAHEIRNPLSTISLNLELMADDLDPAEESPRDRRLLQKIQLLQRECGQLERILNEFLQFVRVGELELVASDLNDVVSEFMAFYRPQADEQGIELSPHLAGDLPPVLLDRATFRQSLLNLALNAEQAMPEGGLLEVQTYARGDRVCLSLIDTGCGMNARTREHMFDAFFSTRSGGSGLGLPTVKKVVEALGGDIECESERARGTRFTITLPVARSV